jgi:hypothetical protein
MARNTSSSRRSFPITSRSRSNIRRSSNSLGNSNVPIRLRCQLLVRVRQHEVRSKAQAWAWHGPIRECTATAPDNLPDSSNQSSTGSKRKRQTSSSTTSKDKNKPTSSNILGSSSAAILLRCQLLVLVRTHEVRLKARASRPGVSRISHGRRSGPTSNIQLSKSITNNIHHSNTAISSARRVSTQLTNPSSVPILPQCP